MKIGVITYHSSLNYGAYLQCYALQKALKKMGYTGSVIDYTAPADVKKYRLVSTKSIKSFIKTIILLPLNIVRKKKFLKALKRINLSSPHELYDVAIVGSDQMWNSNLSGGNLDDYYTLEKIRAGKKISYAVSVGEETIVFENQERFKKIMKELSSVSVREQQAKDALLKATGRRDIAVVLDPTALLTKEEWKKILKKYKPSKKDYIFSYFIDINDKQNKLLTRICEKTKLKTLSYTDIPKEKHIFKHCYSDGPFEFLARLRDAKLVITASFHGTILSIIMRKNFYVLCPKKQRSRLDNILKLMGLEDRLIETEADVEKISFEDIDYTEPQKKLDKLRQESLDWLKNAIKN